MRDSRRTQPATTKLWTLLLLLSFLGGLLGFTHQGVGSVQAASGQRVPFFVPLPAVSLSIGAVRLGSSFTISATFNNSGDAGYGPFIDLYIPHTGADGVYPGTTPGVDEYDGISPQPPAANYSASYLGSSLTVHTLNFPDDGGGSGCVDHPLALDTSGFFQQVCGRAGDQLVVIVLPFGSFTPGQPPVTVEIPAYLSPLADLSTALTIRARAGFQYGATPTVDWCCTVPPDTTILSDSGAPATWTSTGSVSPTVISFSKSGAAETSTGPNFPQTYTLTVDIAEGQTVSSLHIIDSLPENIFYLGNLLSNPAASSITQPAVGGPYASATLDLQYAPILGAAGNDVVVSFDYYVVDMDAGSGSVIPPTTGASSSTVNTASMSGIWTPQDSRDGSQPVSGTGVGTGTNRSLDVGKGGSIAPADDTGASGATPGDIVTYRIDFTISDYFALEDLIATDVIGDGQHFYVDLSHLPRLVLDTNGGSTSLDFSDGNYTVTCNYSGTQGSECEVDDPAANDGGTQVEFRLSDELVGNSLSGQLLGGLVNDGGGADDGATSGQIVFYTQIQDRYADAFSGTNLKQGDSLADTATLVGNLLDVSTCNPGPCTRYAGSPTISDGGSAGVEVGEGSLVKTIFALNGTACAVQPCSDVHVAPGDTVTYRIRYDLVTGDYDGLSLTDYLPLPVFKADDPDASGTLVVTYPEDTLNPIPAVGQWRLGPEDTRAIPPGSVTISGAAASNYVRFNFGSYDDPANLPRTIDLLFTVRVTSEPFADGLQLTNQVQQQDSNSPGSVSTTDRINQLTLTEPVLVNDKTVVSTDHAGIFPSPAIPGPISFSIPGSIGPAWSGGTINSDYLGVDNSALNGGIQGIDGGDLVKFAIVIQNTGSGLNGAFDITLRDALPSGYVIPGIGDQGINLQVTRGDGTAYGYTNVPGGTGLLSLGIQINDPVLPPADPEYGFGACQAHDATNGRNVILVTYDLRVDPTVAPGQLIQNNGEVSSYSGTEGGPNHLPEPDGDTSDTTIGSPALLKDLVGTEIVSATNSSTQAVIGELVHYSLVVTFPEGVSPNTVVTDSLPAGLAFVAMDAATPFVNSNPDTDGPSGSLDEGLSFTGSAVPVVTNSGQTITWTLAEVSNTNLDNSIAETLTFNYTVVVLNVAANQAATSVTNSAVLAWESRDETGATVPSSVGPVSAPIVTIIEPVIGIAKTINPASGDADDPFTYTLTLTGPTSTDAFEVSLEDAFPILMENITWGGTPVTDSAGQVLPTNFILSGDNTVGYSLATITPFDMLAADTPRTITLTFTGTVSYLANPQQQIDNLASVQWTSLDGDVNDRSPENPASDERTGSGIPAVNDYRAANPAVPARFTVTSTGANKYFLLTSEAHTSDLSSPPLVAIGEIVRYRIVVPIPEGTSPNFQIRDNLPAGLTFIGDGPDLADLDSSVQLSFVSNGAGISSSAYGTLPIAGLPGGCNATGSTADASTPVLPLLCVLADANIGSNDSTAADPDFFGSGTDVYFKLGSLLNGDSDADQEFVVIEFNALLDNTSAGSNDAGEDRNNNFDVFISGSQNGITSTTVQVRIAEPSITNLAKSAAPLSGDAGDQIAYQLAFSNAGGVNNTTAFDIRITDTVPGKMTFDSGSLSYSSVGSCAAGFTDNTVGNAVAVSFDSMPAACAVTVSYTATLNDTVTPEEVLANIANIAYTSLPGPEGTTGNATGSDTPGTSGTDTGERDGSNAARPWNDYYDQASASVTVPGVTISKQITATSAAHTSGTDGAIGEVVTYAILLTFPEGTTPADTVYDDIPTGLEILLGTPQLVTSAAASGGLLTADFNGTLGALNITTDASDGGSLQFDFTNLVTNEDGENNTNNTLLLTFQARVTNILANQAGSVLSNTATNQVGSNPATSSNTVAVTVVEPVITFSKTIVSTPVPLDAGGVVHYRISFANAPGASTAMDVVIDDALAADLQLPSTGAPDLVITPTAGVGAITNSSTASAIAIRIASVPAGESVTIDFYPVIQDSLTPAQVVNNLGTSTWTSLSGVIAGERTGGGGVDDYTASDNDGFTSAGAVTISKQITATSATHTSGTDGAIGEVVTYAILLTFPEGTTPADTVFDDIPTGLEILPGTPQLVTSAAASGGLLTADFNGTLGVLNIATDASDGGSLQFDFTNVVTFGDNLTTNNTLLLTFQARVTNILANQAGSVLSNTATNQVGSNPATSSNTVAVTVVEPVITFSKTIVSTPVPLDAGGVVHYRISFANAPGASTAMDVVIDDALAADLQLPSTGAPDLVITPTAGVGAITNSSTASAIAIRIASVPAGESVTIDFYPVIQVGVTPGQLIENSGDATWTSLSGTPSGERTGAGGVDDYQATSPTVSFNIYDPAFSKSITSTDNPHTIDPQVAIGETITFDLVITLPEGTTPSIHIFDDLPAGLRYIVETPTIVPAPGFVGSIPAPSVVPALPPAGSGDDLTVDFAAITVSPDGDLSNNWFSVRFRAVVLNELANQDAASLLNTATITVEGVDYGDDATATIVEPVLTVVKSVNDQFPGPGQTLTFTIVVSNSGPASTAAAQDVVILDDLPDSQLTLVPGSISTSVSGSVSGITYNPVSEPVQVQVERIDVGGSITITFEAIVSSGISVGEAIENTATARWTSMPGVVVDERLGTGGAINDYSASSTVNLSADKSVSKSLVADNHAATVLPEVAIGELLTYEVQFNVPTGTTDLVTLTDQLDLGLGFVDCVSITADAGITTSMGTFSDVCLNAAVSGMGAPSNPASPGRQVVYDFGTLNNTSGSVGSVTVTYRVAVLDVLENQSSEDLNNRANLVWSFGSLYTQAPAPVMIVEPFLLLEKTADATTALPGANITFTLTVSHDTVNSSADAYDVLLRDEIPPDLTLIGLPVHISGIAPTSITVTGPLIEVYWTDFPRQPVGESVIQFTARLGVLPPGDSVSNYATVEWTSLPGIPPNPYPAPQPVLPPGVQSIHNIRSTERRYDPLSTVDIYQAAASAVVRVPALPATGFAPGRVTKVAEQPLNRAYTPLDGLWLEIPSLGVSLPIVGVPASQDGWDLTWLGDQAGYLEGTAYPTWEGNTGITGHVYLPNGQPGPFVNLHSLVWGQQVILHIDGLEYIYQVRDVRRVVPDDLSILGHAENPTLTLITCLGYDQEQASYRYRVAVRAVLVAIRSAASMH